MDQPVDRPPAQLPPLLAQGGNDAEPQEEQEDLEIGLEALADKYGLEKIQDAVARISKKD